VASVVFSFLADELVDVASGLRVAIKGVNVHSGERTPQSAQQYATRRFASFSTSPSTTVGDQPNNAISVA
jgi:hypothetical protein